MHLPTTNSREIERERERERERELSLLERSKILGCYDMILEGDIYTRCCGGL